MRIMTYYTSVNNACLVTVGDIMLIKACLTCQLRVRGLKMETLSTPMVDTGRFGEKCLWISPYILRMQRRVETINPLSSIAMVIVTKLRVLMMSVT